MTHLVETFEIEATRRMVRQLRQTQRAVTMLAAAGIAALSIVGVAASMMVVLF